MAAISFKCPNCGGELIFDPTSGAYKCEYCMSKFSQKELDGAKQQETADTSLGDAEVGNGDAVMYHCPSCGAEIITDATTAATFCYYCHNPVILSGRLDGDFLPDKIIPFEITKEQAIKSFLEFVGKKKFVPKAFFNKQQIERISGVYFPYWNYDVDVESEMDGSGKKVRSWTSGDLRYTETKYYDIKRKGVVSINYLTENALNKANAELARGVMPYHFEKMKDFNMGYLSGFLAEKRDIEKERVKGQLESRAKKYTEMMMRDTIDGYTSVSMERSSAQFHNPKWSYCLLPVWTITYKGRNDKIYFYSMNAQTGEVCGELPLDEKKLAIVSGITAAVILVLGLIGGFLL